jgi:CRISPR-associated protein Cmr1
MQKAENIIFGDCGEEGRSKFSIVMAGGGLMATEMQRMLPHHTGDEKCPYLPDCGKGYKCKKGYTALAFKKQQSFQIILRYNKFPEGLSCEKLQALLKLSACLGGLGKRSRRGFGSFSVISESNNSESLEYLLELLHLVAHDHFTLKQGAIILNKDCTAGYPFINKIEVGKGYATSEKVLLAIGRAAHEAAGKYRDKSLGSVLGGRLASPIYVSVLKTTIGYRPIITTLQMALKDGIGGGETDKQKFFKEAIL